MNKMWLIVFKKELKDFFRDKKTVFTTIFMPLIMMVGMFGLSFSLGNKQAKEVEENFTMILRDNGNSNISTYIKEQKGVKIVDKSDINGAIEDGSIKVAIEIPKGFDEALEEGNVPKVKVYYDNATDSGTTAIARAKDIIDGYKNTVVKDKLAKLNISDSILEPIGVEMVGIKKGDDTSNSISMMIGMMLPYMILLFGASGVMSIATDLGAGEKERGTLEPLLTTKAGRGAIVTGKLLACTVVGLISSLSIIVALLGGLLLLPEMMGLSLPINITVTQILSVGLLTIFLAILYSAIFLSLSFVAKTFKEAQTFASFGMIATIIPAMILMFANVRTVGNIDFIIPLYNVGLLMKMILLEIASTNQIILVTISTLLYAIIAVIGTRYLLSKEEVIFRG
ncbi:ABC transporter permease [uncultured Clostridium sp.]|uniref:ABC transporter permease n=1 Tax=uncultured Clostridium sp. TaxID=59620 RepID=UPI0025F6D0D3|nr:ABC transporter permease [uncultured Clostridium sp.]